MGVRVGVPSFPSFLKPFFLCPVGVWEFFCTRIRDRAGQLLDINIYIYIYILILYFFVFEQGIVVKSLNMMIPMFCSPSSL